MNAKTDSGQKDKIYFFKNKKYKNTSLKSYYFFIIFKNRKFTLGDRMLSVDCAHVCFETLECLVFSSKDIEKVIENLKSIIIIKAIKNVSHFDTLDYLENEKKKIERLEMIL